MRPLNRILAGALALAAALFVTVDVRHGDLRRWGGEQPHAFNLTVRNWVLSVYSRPACAAGFIPGGGFPCGSSGGGGATSYTLSGPATGQVNVASTNYSVAANGSTTALVTPADATHHCVFSPATVNLNNTNPVTFNCTPLAAGTGNLSTTNGGGLTDPAAISVAVPNVDSPGYPGLTANWNTNFVTLTTGGAGDPFGGSNTATITEDTSANQHLINHNYTDTANVQRRRSIFVEPGSGTRNVAFGACDGTFTNCPEAIFNPSSCTFVADISNIGAPGTGIGLNGTETRLLANGWCLIVIITTVGNFTDIHNDVSLINGTTPSYTGDGTSSLKLSYGVVVE